MIRVIVVNRHHNPEGSNVVYVGRPTIWGNPFVVAVGKSSGYTREVAITRYEDRFAYRVSTDDAFRRATLALLDRAVDGYLMLSCSCAPKRCHADVIAKWLNEQIAERER